MEELPKKSEPKIGPEKEPKVEVGKVERTVKKFLEGKRDYFFEMYKLMPKEERKEVEKYIIDSKEIASERKEELLDIAEHLDSAAEREYKYFKDELKDMTPRRREEELKKAKEKAEFQSRDAEEIDKESKMEGLTDTAILTIVFKRLDEMEKLEKILTAMGMDRERMPSRSFRKAKDELELKKKELASLSDEEKRKREGINSAKGDYYGWGWKKEKREEDVEIWEEKTKRFERILKETEAEEKK